MALNSREYFANQDAEDVISRLEDEQNKWYIAGGLNTSTFSSSLQRSIFRNITAYYSTLIAPSGWDTSLVYAGEQGELVKMQIPVSRTLIKQYCALLTKQRQYYECLTDVNDSNPQVTARLGKALCNHIVEKQRIDEKLEKVTERGNVIGSAYMSCVWDLDKGSNYSPNNAQGIEKSGDINIQTHDFWDVVYDWSIEDWGEMPWVLLMRPKNRWDLVARYPEMKDAILSAPSVRESRQLMSNFNFLVKYDNPDMIYLKEFYHTPTSAVPYGRVLKYVGSDAILEDQRENPYGCLPVVPFIFEKIATTSLGYPLYSSLLPCQELYDHSASVLATNQSAFGVQAVLCPKGANMSAETMAGLNFIYYEPQNAEGGGKPEPLQLTSTPAEIPNFMQILDKKMGDLSMITDTLRGSPPANVTSGEMVATLSMSALDFLSGPAKVLALGMEQVMNLGLKCYKLFASVEQIIDVVGDGNIAYVQTFKSDDLKALRQVKVRTQNPLMSSVTGRMMVADSFAAKGVGVDPRKLISIFEGVPLENVFEPTLTTNTSVQQEISMLLRGENVIPGEYENHPVFIAEYLQLISNPYVKARSELLEPILFLFNERVKFEMMMDPVKKALLRGQPLPPPPPPGAPPQGGPGPAQAMQAGGPQASEAPPMPTGALPSEPAPPPL